MLVLRSSDIATYVAHGAADAGGAGSDVLNEEGRELYEPLDLGIGRGRMIVAGRVSRKMAPVLRRLYDQMPDPKWVLSMGDCASCGGVFNNYAIVQGVDEIVPVDGYVAGCPPRPEALIDGIVKLHEKIRRSHPIKSDKEPIRV